MPFTIKRIVRILRNTLFCLLALILLYLAAGFCLSRITVSKSTGEPEELAIYIKTNGVHTDLVVPATNEVYDWRVNLPFSDTPMKDSSNIHWLALGWGDKGFYLETPTWADLKISTACKAAFAMSTTAIHATWHQQMEESSHSKKIMLSKNQYRKLTDYINASFKHNETGKPRLVKTTVHYNNSDAFYEATGRYSLFKTCNSWANAALKQGGLKACVWTAFDTGIFACYQ